eukprot:TRINITY_DN10468_c1_g1_i1.p2 TRINITY_DN10468_c1_g1~~TRINITY_DN10468_c1_g1_i1.p2  ORF type:complete len:164 (-),score=14.76 TRINITY_DN10468_c1_g1_i1:110-601(-)
MTYRVKRTGEVDVEGPDWAFGPPCMCVDVLDLHDLSLRAPPLMEAFLPVVHESMLLHVGCEGAVDVARPQFVDGIAEANGSVVLELMFAVLLVEQNRLAGFPALWCILVPPEQLEERKNQMLVTVRQSLQDFIWHVVWSHGFVVGERVDQGVETVFIANIFLQ